jgi:hypothetical protein
MVLEGDRFKTRLAVPQSVRYKEFKVQGFLKGMEFIEQLCCCKFVKKDDVQWCSVKCNLITWDTLCIAECVWRVRS